MKILTALLLVSMVMGIPYHEVGFTYDSCMPLASYYNLYWNYNDDQIINMTIEANTNSWVGVGFARLEYQGQMVPLGIDGLDVGLHHDGVVGYLDLDGVARVLDMRLNGKFYGPDGVYPDVELDGVNNLRDTNFIREEGTDEAGRLFTRTMATFVRDFNTEQVNDILLTTSQSIIYAMGPMDDDGLIDPVLLQHGDDQGDESFSGSVLINFAQDQGCNGIDIEKQLETGQAFKIGCSGSNGVCRGCRCICNEGYTGEFCQVSTACPPNNGGPPCSGNGECLPNGVCDCDANWAAPDCANPADPNIIGPADNAGVLDTLPSLLLPLLVLFSLF